MKTTIAGFLGAVCWSLMGLFCKLCQADAWMIIGIRSLVAGTLLGLFRRSFACSPTRGNLMGSLGVGATGLLYVLAVRHTSAANAIALEYAMTAVVLVYSAVKNRRFPSRAELVTVIGVIGGVALCCVQGMRGGGLLGNVFAGISALTYALVFIAAEREDADPAAYACLGNLLCAPLLLLGLSSPFSAEALLLIFLMGVSQAVGYALMTYAIRSLPSVSAAVLSEVDPALNPVWVFLFMGETPGFMSVMGVILVLSAVAFHSVTAQNGNDKINVT